MEKYPKSIFIMGERMEAAGIGKYPYECKSKDKCPNAMIYQRIHTAGNGADTERVTCITWIHSEDELYKKRMQSLDTY